MAVDSIISMKFFLLSLPWGPISWSEQKPGGVNSYPKPSSQMQPTVTSFEMDSLI